MHLRRFSGCYECHAIVDPTRCPGARAARARARARANVCSECGEIFPNNERHEEESHRKDHRTKTSENQKFLDAKQLIDTIPKTKDELFSYKINWAVYDQNTLYERLSPWIAKKISGRGRRYTCGLYCFWDSGACISKRYAGEAADYFRR